MVHKKDIIHLLEKIAIYMELKGDNPFKIAAFRKAAAALEQDERSLAEITDITKISGIGKGTAAVIQEYAETGESTVLTELAGEVPEGLVALLGLPGLGGKKIAKLYKELGITNMQELKSACEENRVQALAGFGAKTEEKILAAVENAGTRPDRLPIMYVLPIAEKIEAYLKSLASVSRFSRAGSLRRLRETVKDLDFIVASENPEQVKEQLLAIEEIKEVIAAGPTKVSVVLSGEFDMGVDFRIVEPAQYASALHHFTGSKDHNVKIRQIAKARGEKVSEYGIEQPDGQMKTFESEKELYHHLGLPHFPPEIREDGTETDSYKEGTLLELSHIKGDLHMHTTWSDGAFSIEEMIEACRMRGYEYMAITDHSRYLKVANGLSIDRLLRQNEEIKEWNEKYSDIEVLSGIEMDILPDGTLDYENDVLKQLDFVIAAIHSSFSQPQEQIMKRLETALRNPYVKLIAHPTGRIIGRRPGYPVDMKQLIALAAETGTALELNANPHRLDLSADHLKAAQEAGVNIIINTDAHAVEHLEFMETGASAGRKGWLRPETVLNTWPKEKLLSFFRSL